MMKVGFIHPCKDNSGKRVRKTNLEGIKSFMGDETHAIWHLTGRPNNNSEEDVCEDLKLLQVCMEGGCISYVKY